MPSSDSSSTLGKGNITLSGAEETLLLTLYARALDAESSRPVLSDQYAVELASEIRGLGYDFKRAAGNGVGKSLLTSSVCMRARMLDICTEKFLRKHPGPATVLHLACGLDSRSLRVRWQGEGRLWIDADQKEAVDLRRKLMKEPEPSKGEYRLIQPNIHDDAWLSEYKIPADRPVIVVCEGLTPYLTEDEIYGLFRRIISYFQQRGTHGEIRFDAIGALSYYAVNIWFNATLKLMGTRFSYYLNDPRTLEQNVPGLKFKERMFGMPDLLTLGLFGWVIGFLGWLTDLFGITGWIGGGYGFEF
ncbi:O-methyltransferase [Colletotrichum navitas]|uniref:O-methyltransferase n=1 Tax=Colletotrichum navitas TaxID=681940 RepID=A0AAD8QB29_9PEZI|nr:O-methyltransferase [Colletotrichum navitas]KAK1598944.1 O-methyltransferase [Colletotrichum navitas]